MKFFLSIVSGIIIGVAGSYIILNLQEEDLTYTVSTPALFGDTNYQNIHIENSGWNPAVNVEIRLDHPSIDYSAIQTDTLMTEIPSPETTIGLVDRIRRDETITIALAYTGAPLTESEISVVSNRSVAQLVELDDDEGFWATYDLFFYGLLAGIFLAALLDSLPEPSRHRGKRRRYSFDKESDEGPRVDRKKVESPIPESSADNDHKEKQYRTGP